jgi:hypothetical protein
MDSAEARVQGGTGCEVGFVVDETQQVDVSAAAEPLRQRGCD